MDVDARNKSGHAQGAASSPAWRSARRCRRRAMSAVWNRARSVGRVGGEVARHGDEDVVALGRAVPFVELAHPGLVHLEAVESGILA